MKIFRGLAVFVLVVAGLAAAEANRTRNVILVTIDGLRWQEVFRGAEEGLINADKVAGGGVPENQLVALRSDFGGETAAERRRKLMPFFWGVVAKEGQVFGNRDVGSPASVTNVEWVSYPGYSELLSGRADPVIVSNAPIPNPNVTVLEWLHGRPGFAGKVAAVGEWGVFTAIFNVGRSRLPVWVTRQHSPPSMATPRLLEIERWMDDITPLAADEHFDAFAHHAALDFYDTRRPRVFFLGYGEPDTWAHARRYDRYLTSIQRCDRFIRTLWEKLQALPEYRGNTTIILSPDHGRGVLPADWTSHGKKTPRSNETWLAALGPDTPALGERRDTPEVHQAQIAATLAALLGEDFRSSAPDIAPPIADVLGKPAK